MSIGSRTYPLVNAPTVPDACVTLRGGSTGVFEPVAHQDRQHRAGVGGEATRPAGRKGHHGPPLLRPEGCHGPLQGPAEHPAQAPLCQQVPHWHMIIS